MCVIVSEIVFKTQFSSTKIAKKKSFLQNLFPIHKFSKMFISVHIVHWI